MRLRLEYSYVTTDNQVKSCELVGDFYGLVRLRCSSVEGTRDIPDCLKDCTRGVEPLIQHHLDKVLALDFLSLCFFFAL